MTYVEQAVKIIVQYLKRFSRLAEGSGLAVRGDRVR
jgi:hypothetical protein